MNLHALLYLNDNQVLAAERLKVDDFSPDPLLAYGDIFRSYAKEYWPLVSRSLVAALGGYRDVQPRTLDMIRPVLANQLHFKKVYRRVTHKTCHELRVGPA